MRIAKVVGNMVSSVKDESHYGYKMMIVSYLDEEGQPVGEHKIAFDAAQAGINDIVLVNQDGGAANMILGSQIIADLTICGIVDHF